MVDVSAAIRRLTAKMRDTEQRTAEKYGPFTRSVEAFDFSFGEGESDVGTIGVIRDRDGEVIGYCHPESTVCDCCLRLGQPMDGLYGSCADCALCASLGHCDECCHGENHKGVVQFSRVIPEGGETEPTP